jgi:hypothetical protein
MVFRKVMAKPWKTEFLSYSVHPTKVRKGVMAPELRGFEFDGG